MTASHTRINNLNFFGFNVGIFTANRSKLRLNGFFLFCFVKVVFPTCFQLLVRMPFYPKSTERVFDHITNNPIRCKELGCCRNSFFCDFYILFQFCKGIIFQFCIVILIQPPNDFNLSGRITFFIQCRYIKISFWNT